MAKTNNLTRICCVCHNMQTVDEMTRVVRVGDTFCIQENKRLNGRGCHVCPICLSKAIEKKMLNRSFKCQVPEYIYKQLAIKVQRDKLEK